MQTVGDKERFSNDIEMGKATQALLPRLAKRG